MVSTWTSSLNCTVFFSVFTAEFQEKVENDQTVAQTVLIQCFKATQEKVNMAETSLGINKNTLQNKGTAESVKEVESVFCF